MRLFHIHNFISRVSIVSTAFADKKLISIIYGFAVSAEVRVQLLRGQPAHASRPGTQGDAQRRRHERPLLREPAEGRKQDERQLHRRRVGLSSGVEVTKLLFQRGLLPINGLPAIRSD